ncbi:hypothetical protein MesoLjLc_51250 [Mesorhizobium sp. L-8-10]|uniref:hypothetical protein n=1 Tax=Mesorhizobium sp. L-8-10 TaxID=2744523 RepID=UPI00192874A5|nr:hypothetical protein [Mesorhizobium sp. L-8-10]BCH33195.1 hypothetical protein MesoLjLc_51250 [Mesorhizobium sp. L-8-10]
MADRPSQDIAAAEAAININLAQMRLEDDGNRETRLLHLLVSLLEWSDAHGIDFDAAVYEVRQYFAEAENRKAVAMGAGADKAKAEGR